MTVGLAIQVSRQLYLQYCEYTVTGINTNTKYLPTDWFVDSSSQMAHIVFIFEIAFGHKCCIRQRRSCTIYSAFTIVARPVDSSKKWRMGKAETIYTIEMILKLLCIPAIRCSLQTYESEYNIGSAHTTGRMHI